MYIGKSLYDGCPAFAGLISEVIVYARELADADVLSVEKYLQAKYGY